MRLPLLLCLFLSVLNLHSQTTKIGPVKIRHEALEMHGDQALYKGKPFTGLSFTFWENRKIHEEYSWKDGYQDGLYKENTDEGILVTSITYKNGQKNGPYVYYYDNGAKQSEGEFLDGTLNGVIKGYYSSGIPKYSITYTRGVRNGESRTWFKNGAPEQVAYYVNDLPDGEVYEYYPDSLTWSESEYKMGVRNGRLYEFHRKSGCPAIESYYKNGLLDSIRRVWNEINCGLIEEEYYKNGQKNGPFILYDFMGDTLSLRTYENDILNGIYIEYYSKTKPDIADGVVTKYDELRGIEVTGNYSEGKRDGYWKFGLTSNYQHREGNYHSGQMVGEWHFYDIKGRILMIQWYDEQGNFLKEKQYKHPRKK